MKLQLDLALRIDDSRIVAGVDADDFADDAHDAVAELVEERRVDAGRLVGHYG